MRNLMRGIATILVVLAAAFLAVTAESCPSQRITLIVPFSPGSATYSVTRHLAKAGSEEAFDVLEPSIDSHIVKLKATGADVLLGVATPKFAAQAIKKVAELDWKSLHLLSYVSASIGSVIKPAGLENAQGIISAAYFKDPNDPKWKDDAGLTEFNAFLDKYYPEANRSDALIVNGHNTAELLVHVLKQCGDDLTRENIMKQAASLNNIALGMLVPEIRVSTLATDFAPVKLWQLMRFEGTNWQLFGDVIDGGARE